MNGSADEAESSHNGSVLEDGDTDMSFTNDNQAAAETVLLANVRRSDRARRCPQGVEDPTMDQFGRQGTQANQAVTQATASEMG